jgi:hypothetical protein
MSTSSDSSAGSNWSRESIVCAREGEHEVEEMIVLDCEYDLGCPDERGVDSGRASLNNGVCSVISSVRGKEWAWTKK